MSTLVPSTLRAPSDATLRIERAGRPYTAAEVDAAGDEGSEWWEADKGVLIVNAPPTLIHQRWVDALSKVWLAAAASRWEVVTGPQRVVLSETTWAHPDVAIWPLEPEGSQPGLSAAPVLVAEVISPTTARRDRQDKQALYARAGVTWLVLAEPAEVPVVEVFQLEPTGDSRRMVSAVGEDSLECPLTGADLTPVKLAFG
jgi:Uma2 family endonuclease